MTQTNDDDLNISSMSPPLALHKLKDCADDLDNLDILSLCEGTTDEYDITEDDYLSDDRKLDKSIDTASSCTKSSSAERDDDSDVVILRNQSNSNRAPSACSLPQESIRLHATSYPIHYSDKSLHGLKSECSSSSSGGSTTISNALSRAQLRRDDHSCSICITNHTIMFWSCHRQAVRHCTVGMAILQCRSFQ